MNNFFDNALKKFLDRIDSTNIDTSINNDDADNKRTLLFVLPYFEKVSKEFEKKLKKSSLLKIFLLEHKFTCLRDARITYLGETTRPLKLRVDEHLNGKNKSAVGRHIMNCAECKNKDFSLQDFHIVKQCQTPGDTRVHEALLIRKHSPLINKQLYLAGASFILSVY